MIRTKRLAGGLLLTMLAFGIVPSWALAENEYGNACLRSDALNSELIVRGVIENWFCSQGGTGMKLRLLAIASMIVAGAISGARATRISLLLLQPLAIHVRNLSMTRRTSQ